MSTNYLSVILAWMKQNPSHLNWDLTYAVRPEQVNDLVELAHYSREGSALGDIDGEIAVPGTGITHILTGYRMGPPRLSDLEAAYASPKVRQTIDIEGGSQLIMDHSEGLLGLAVHDPLDPLRVSQQLLLDANGQGVHADLGDGVETELDLGGGLAQRLAAGRFFNDFVSGLDSARRVYPLVDFKALSGSAYLQVRDSAVRTHVSKADGKPALVVFAGLEHGSSGNFPTELTNYPFLLPDDLEQPVSSTLVLSSQLLHRASFRIVDPPMMLAPGKRHAFTTEPVLDGLNWTIEALPGAVGDIGRIDGATGEYRAPPLHAMGGEHVRVRVIATDASGQRSSTLATVLLGALTVNPLIRVCYIDDQLTFTAGTLGGDLRWSVLDPEGEGRGTLAPSEDGKRCSYTAGGLVPGNQTYVLDEIKVENTEAGQSRTVHVLVRQRRPELAIEIVDQLPDGSLQLQGRVNGEVRAGVEWRLPIGGTGEIRDGRYLPPSSDADRPFALIIAKWEIPGFDFVFEGHLILPLPLALHFDTLQRATSPAGLRVSAKQSSRG